MNDNKEVPEEIQDRLARAAAAFKVKTGAQHEDIVEFMQDIIQIYSDYAEMPERN